MTCHLEKDGDGLFDALATAGESATVFVKSKASPQVQVTAAKFNGDKVDLADDGTVPLPPFKKNTNVLNITVEGIQAGDDIQLLEACERPKTLSKKKVGSAPNGSDPVVGFRISAS